MTEPMYRKWWVWAISAFLLLCILVIVDEANKANEVRKKEIYNECIKAEQPTDCYRVIYYGQPKGK